MELFKLLICSITKRNFVGFYKNQLEMHFTDEEGQFTVMIFKCVNNLAVNDSMIFFCNISPELSLIFSVVFWQPHL
jgi:hypothetical protein